MFYKKKFTLKFKKYILLTPFYHEKTSVTTLPVPYHYRGYYHRHCIYPCTIYHSESESNKKDYKVIPSFKAIRCKFL